jgi:inner membrane transporter RhtA
MSCIQFGTALSAPLIALYGTVGTTWLRLLIAASALLLFVRPSLRSYSAKQWISATILGLVTATMTLCLFSAMERIPLGLAVAIDFMGPLSVATFAYGFGWRLVFPLIAFAGVLLLSHDGHGWVGNMAGIGFAAASGVCWAIYILLTQRVGSLFKGMEGLTLSLSVAALVCMPFSFTPEILQFNPVHLLPVVGLAILVPLLPFVLEMMALRMLPTATFGILMSLEPSLGAIAGFLVLGQFMTLSQMAGVALVVVASIGATIS